MKITAKTDCCCSGPSGGEHYQSPVFVQDAKLTIRGTVPIISTQLTFKERLEHWRVRWGISRMHYRVQPGLYGVGDPDQNAPVLVTCNYKLTFDLLRRELTDLNAWILVLDTNGINVWCSAGKGTFGTAELVSRIRSTRLTELLTHHRIILPQLAAPGVAAHEVQEQTGLHVVYGPIYAKDLPTFLRNGEKATPAMRRIHFTIKDRLTLVPMELIPSLKLVPIFIIWLAISWFAQPASTLMGLVQDFSLLMASLVCGTILFQILLPWIPLASFAAGGWLLGGVVTGLLSLFFKMPEMKIAANLFLVPPIAAFLALNFTGSTTFTSLSGVQKEMKYSVPLMIGSLIIGIAINLVYWI